MKNRLFSAISSFTFAFIASYSNLKAEGTTIYLSQDEKSYEQAVVYSSTNKSLSRYLAYRDLPFFIAKYCHGKECLDYGAGTGCSTEFLQKQSLEVTGVDISQEMLTQAVHNYPETPFYLIKNGSIPSKPEAYDLVFSSFVLFELGSEKEILSYLEEAKRVLKNDGVFISVTGSQEMYSRDWLIFKTEFPENKNLKSGNLAKVYLCDAAIEFTDYYWTEADYRRLFDQSGLDILEIHYPTGKATEPYAWKDERMSSPFVILIARKKS